MTPSDAYGLLFLVALLCLSAGILLCLIRAIRGPRIADRIVAINMISTMIIACVCLLAVYMNQSGLLDVALIYALLGFVAVIVLCKVFLGRWAESKAQKEKEDRS